MWQEHAALLVCSAAGSPSESSAKHSLGTAEAVSLSSLQCCPSKSGNACAEGKTGWELGFFRLHWQLLFLSSITTSSPVALKLLFWNCCFELPRAIVPLVCVTSQSRAISFWWMGPITQNPDNNYAVQHYKAFPCLHFDDAFRSQNERAKYFYMMWKWEFWSLLRVSCLQLMLCTQVLWCGVASAAHQHR